MVRGWGLVVYPHFGYFFRYPNSLFYIYMYPSLVDSYNLLRDVTEYVGSNLPDTINHWKILIIY